MNQDHLLKYFAAWIENETGIIYEEHNLYQLQDRLEQLARKIEISGIEGLYEKAQKGIQGEFRRLLIDISTNNETSFFRDPKFFECLEKKVIPDLIQTCGSLSQIRIWSVASSTGQEPYSVAMILSELGKKLNQVPPKILATDICERALAKAQKAEYNEIEIGRGLELRLKSAYFESDVNSNWSALPHLKNMVQFQSLNLRSAFSLGQQFDLILCRNVLIYQRVEAKSAIINKIIEHLRPGGIFLLGSGESLIGLSTAFNQKLIDGVAVYQRKNEAKAAA